MSVFRKAVFVALSFVFSCQLASASQTQQTVENLMSQKIILDLSANAYSKFLEGQIEFAKDIIVKVTGDGLTDVGSLNRFTTDEIVEMRKQFSLIDDDPFLSNLDKKASAGEAFSRWGEAGLNLVSIGTTTYTITQNIDNVYDEEGNLDASIAASIGYSVFDILTNSTQFAINAFPSSAFTEGLKKTALGKLVTNSVFATVGVVTTLAQLESQIYTIFRDQEIDTIKRNYLSLSATTLQRKADIVEELFFEQLEMAENGEELDDIAIYSILDQYLGQACYSNNSFCPYDGVKLSDVYKEQVTDRYYLEVLFDKTDSATLTANERVKVAINLLAEAHYFEMQDIINYMEDRWEENSSVADFIASIWPFSTTNDIFEMSEFYKRINPCYGVGVCSGARFYETLFFGIYDRLANNEALNFFNTLGQTYLDVWGVVQANDQVTLTVDIIGDGGVSSDDGKIQCSTHDLVCSTNYDIGSLTGLNVEETPGYYFSGWTGYCSGSEPECDVTLDKAEHVGAVFSNCISLEYSWIKTGNIYAGYQDNFDSQFKLVNQCDTDESLASASVVLQKTDDNSYHECFGIEPVTIEANGEFYSKNVPGNYYCTIDNPGSYKVIQRVELLDGTILYNNIQYTNILPAHQPQPPSQPSASDGEYKDKVDISWTSVPGADSYKIFRCPNIAEIGCFEVGSSTSLSYTDRGAETNIRYYYRVKSHNVVGGDSGYSSFDLGYRMDNITLPSPPETVSATDGFFSDKVNVTWSSVDNINSYLIFRCSNTSTDTCVAIDQEATTSCTDTKGLGGVQYYYRIKSVDNNGISANFSAEDVGHRSGSSEKPHKPINLTATNGTSSSKVGVEWSAVDDAIHYIVYRCNDTDVSSCNQMALSNTASYDDISGVTGKSYYYRTLAVNGMGEGPLSDPDLGYRSNTTSVPVIPGKPSASDGLYLDKVNISWQPVDSVGLYKIFRCTNSTTGSCSLLSTTSTTSYNDISLPPGVTYYYRVKSSNGEDSDFSDYDRGTVSSQANMPLPGAPSASKGLYSDEILVTWNGVSMKDALYEVYRCTDTSLESCKKIASTPGLSRSDTTSDGIGPNKNYYYRLRITSITGNGLGDFTDYDIGYLGNVAATMEAPVASFGTFGNKVEFSWTPVSDATHYEAYACTVLKNSNDSAGIINDCIIAMSSTRSHYGDGTPFTESEHSTAVPGVKYYYYMRARNSAGWGGFSPKAAGYAGLTTPLTPSLLINSDYDKVNIHVSRYNDYGASYYDFFRCWNYDIESCEQFWSSPVKEISSGFDDYGVNVNATYIYRAKSVSYAGEESEFSQGVLGGTIKRLGAPTSLVSSFKPYGWQPSDEHDYFGASISSSRDRIIVGYRGNDIGGDNVGSAVVYKKDQSDIWDIEATLVASDVLPGDQFGSSVSIDNERALVKSSSGKVYVFDYQSGGMWIQKAKLLFPDGALIQGDSDVILSGDYAFVGAENAQVNGLTAGAVYVFKLQQVEGWTLFDILSANDASDGARFGNKLACSGGTLIVGAKHDSQVSYKNGAVYVYEIDMNGFFQLKKKLVPTSSSTELEFGYDIDVSLDEKKVVASAKNTNNGSDGNIYVFELLDSSVWVESANLQAPDMQPGDLFGSSISLSKSGMTLVAGAPGVGANDTGGFYIYSYYQDAGWVLQEKVLAPASADRHFGASLAIEGNKLLIGSPLSNIPTNINESPAPGVAYLYQIYKENKIVTIQKKNPFTTEAGGQYQFYITLEQEPKDDVLVELQSSNIAEGSLSASQLTFTRANWYIPQLVTVTGYDDKLLDGNQSYTVVTSPAESSDPNYHSLDSTDVELINREDGIPIGITMIGKGSVSISPVDVECDRDCTIFIGENSDILITASAADGYQFVGWQSLNCSDGDPCSLVMAQPINVVAHFKAIDQQLNIISIGDGEVHSFSAGIDCGVDCSETYNHGSQVAIFAQPGPGSIFSGWGGSACVTENPCTVHMDQAQNITATFYSPSDLIISDFTSNKDVVYPGLGIMLQATVKNQGRGQANPTILDYYLSTDLSISTSDVQVPDCSEGVESLPSGDSSTVNCSYDNFNITQNVTYYFGACVVAVDGETLTNNNCSPGFAVQFSTSIIDSDNDGINDIWEQENFGDLTTATATSDKDQDSYTDLQEYLNSIDGVTDPDGFSFDPNERNVPRGVGYVRKNIAIAPVLMLLLNNDHP